MLAGFALSFLYIYIYIYIYIYKLRRKNIELVARYKGYGDCNFVANNDLCDLERQRV